jgi:hypothetical protein
MKSKTLVKFFIICIALFFFLIQVWVEFEQHPDDVKASLGLIEKCEDISLQDSVRMQVINGRAWTEYMNNGSFCSEYNVMYQDVNDAASSRNNISIENWTTDPDYWRQVYRQLYMDNKDHLQSVQDSLLMIKVSMQLDRDAFARMVVSFVQDIPYEYVIPDQCTGNETAPCNGDVSLGIYSPVEFLGAMHGDCDTRTVLLYTLLRNFGYQPLIINSKEYLHSMLALDVASSGDDFEWKGRKYAYWETTNVGWLPGMLPPNMNNKDYWEVALDYEF